MKKSLMSLAVLSLSAGLLTAAPVQAAPFGWRHAAPGYYYADKQVDRATVEKKAKEALAGVTKGEAWKSPSGVNHIPLVNKDKLVVGNLWEDADLGALEVGAFWVGRGGTKAELVSGGKVVGTLWIQ
ncbi:hypothetical protein [Azohydromonas sediminis]|uniref:hypothetical protein n=1 Tax=Azohydromonas sediminis TaxID=2259674 RepID=UPI0013C34140|nr:hypothetical protein [Azohydromonas sediminis]